MMQQGGELRIDRIELTTAGPDLAATGLLGWVRCRLNGVLQLSCIALRRTLDGRHVLSFPARVDAAGERHFIVRPLDDRTRIEIEHQILCALGLAA